MQPLEHRGVGSGLRSFFLFIILPQTSRSLELSEFRSPELPKGPNSHVIVHEILNLKREKGWYFIMYKYHDKLI
jgi:hypothetical protein